MREGVAAVALAAVCVLAGCGGYLGDPAPTDSGAVTPAPVPSPEPDLAPGIHPNRVNASAVADAHDSVLRDSAYDLYLSVAYRGPDGNEHRERVVGRFRPDGEAVGFAQRYSPPRDSVTGFELWYDGERTLYRKTYADGSEERLVIEERNAVAVPLRNFTRTVFRTADGHAVERTGPKGTVVSATVDETGRLPVPPSAERPRNATLTARVSPAGLIDRLELYYDVTVDGESVPVRFETRIENVSATAPEPPEWVHPVTETDERR